MTQAIPETQPDLYDVVVYPTHAYENTHPSRLAVMALLHGLSPAPVERCRVLEIGCNAGANLIPMAYALPESRFAGFDLAGVPIAQGQQLIEKLSLKNIHLAQADLMQAGQLPEFAGEFDYIIAHGVYAWVPQLVRDGLLRYCREHLAKNGVAFISYAALPGGYLRKISRDIMLFRDPELKSGPESVKESMSLLKFFAESRPEGDGFRVLLERELYGMERRGPYVVFHDELASEYEPVSITQFAQHATAHELRYFSEAELPPPKDPCYRAEVAAAIKQLAGGDPVAAEQMLDFTRMRMYRESLLCRAEAAFTYDLQAEALKQLWFSSKAESKAGSTEGVRTYVLPNGISIDTQHSATIAMLELLIARTPEVVPFDEVTAMLASHGITTGRELMLLLLRLVISRMVDLHAWRVPVACDVEQQPLASAVARTQVANDRAAENVLVTTLLHTELKLSDSITRRLVELLDGTRDRETLLRELAFALPEVDASTLSDGLEPALQVLGRTGVLERR